MPARRVNDSVNMRRADMQGDQGPLAVPGHIDNRLSDRIPLGWVQFEGRLGHPITRPVFQASIRPDVAAFAVAEMIETVRRMTSPRHDESV